MASTVTLKAAGLVTSPNALDRTEGSLSEAKNIIIRRDSVIEPVRGFKLYGDTLPSEVDRFKQLLVYRNRIIRHYNQILQFDNGDGSYTDFTGNYSETESGLRIKSVVSNGNFYFTSSEGIKKISAVNAAGISAGGISNAGGIKALNVNTAVNYDNSLQTGFLPQDSTIAYRILWNTKDSNNNLIQGVPSERSIVTVPMTDIMLQDYMVLLGSLDDITDTTTTARIGDGDYVSSLSLGINSTASALRTNLISLSTKLDLDILYANQAATAPVTVVSGVIAGSVCTITTSAANISDYLQVGSNITLSGFATGVGTINGPQVVTAITATTFSFVTTATGAVTVTGSAVQSNEYGDITQPAVPSELPTNAELVAIQDYMDAIISRLQTEPDGTGTLSGVVISPTNKTTYIDVLDITTTVTVDISFTVPDDVDTNYFYQVYRSPVSQATGSTILSDLSPSDELQLVIEEYYNGVDSIVTLNDITPDAFRGANLYTNPSSGEGISQSNELPPWAKDINRFRNYTFFSNTRSRHRLQVSLLGVQNMITDYDGGTTPTLTIADESLSNTYTFIVGAQETTDITCIADVADNRNGTYFDLNGVDSLNVVNKYRFYYKTSGGADTPPAVTDQTLVKILINTGDSANVIAGATRDVINRYPVLFNCTDNTLPKIEVQNVFEGDCDDASAGTSGFTVNVTTQGVGENATNKQVLLSNVVSVAQAVENTARSLCRVVNQQPTVSESIYCYYISGTVDVPGKMLFESRSLTDDPFYILANNSITGASFNPVFSPADTIASISIANPSVVTTTTNHGLETGDQVIMTNTDSTPNTDGVHTVIVTGVKTFTIPVNVTGGGTQGSYSPLVDAQISENEKKVNRVYYSKFQQPEAVPLVNYFDVGDSDKEILRIYPLRDSLFIFKEDGLYRISGEFAPFNLTLFDSSFIVNAPDSVSVTNNLVFAWTTQGIQILSESSPQIISRSIDVDILKLSTTNYPNFRTSTWGIGYESDNSYIVYTVKNTSDTYATQAYRFSTLTNTWSTLDREATCGLINPADSKMYIGAGDINSLEQERKDFSREDYANREYVREIQANKINEDQIRLTDITNMEIGDVITQDQGLTIYQFNTLLSTLDTDTGIVDTDYRSTLEATAGDNMRANIEALATKLDSDAGTATSTYLSDITSGPSTVINAISEGATQITCAANHGLIDDRIITISSSDSNPLIDGEYVVTVVDATNFTIPVTVTTAGTTGTFVVEDEDIDDIKVCYNKIIENLNGDSGVNFNSYVSVVVNTLQEAIITNVDRITSTITVNQVLNFYAGDITLYKAIESTFTYAPNTMGDPLSLKHLRESTIVFENKALTSGTLSFKTDLLPSFVDINMDFDGNGIFGTGTGNFGNGYFGGQSHSAPIRTYIPSNCQRCTYIVAKFTHKIAREHYSFFAITITGKMVSTKAYR